MAGGKWQIGLDIQPHGCYAVAVARRRGRHQLHGGWHLPLPVDEPLSGEPVLPENQLDTLRRWRALLPRRFSLRVALPAARVLQRSLPAPAAQLQAPHRETFLLAQAARHFPLERDALVFDYRTPPGQPQQVVVTAAHRQELAAWLARLQGVGLEPEVVDIAPCALHYLGALAGVPPDALMLHHLPQGWLWVAPRASSFQYGTAGSAEYAAAVRAALPEPLQSLPCFFSSALPEPVPEAMQDWAPFSRLPGTLPAESVPGAFVLAAGLAVRPEDRE